jgi:hypothetical protein
MLTLNLPSETVQALEHLAKAHHTTPTAILQAFTLDLTRTPGNGGSDERELAEDWFRRNCGPARWVLSMPLPAHVFPTDPVFVRTGKLAAAQEERSNANHH